MLRITEIFFNYCGHHSLWRSAGRKIRNKFLILVSDEFYPCRTTGCQKRKFFSFFDSIQELRCFFHNGKVSTETCIINFIKSHTVKCIDDFAHYTSAFLEAVMVTNSYTNCRSDLCNHTDFRIRQSLPDFIRICMNGNRSGRTEYTALATVYALCFCNLFVECRHNHSFCSTECKSKCSDSLNLLAGTYTVAAEDTFIRITYYGWRTEIQFMMLSCIFESDVSYSETMCQFLKYTFTALDTGCTVTAVCCKKQLHDQLTIVSQSSGICINYHSISRLFGTGCKCFASVIFNRT